MKTPEELAEEYCEHHQCHLQMSCHARAFLAGYQAARAFYETRIEELETLLENAEMLATHGQEGL